MRTRLAAMVIIAAVAAMCLSGCAPDDPQASAPKTPCAAMADVAGSPYASPGQAEVALELLRVRCLGMTANGSRQLRNSPAPSRVSHDPQSAPDDATMFKWDMQAVPPQ